MSSTRYFPALDGLRAVAVGIVLAAHGGVPWFRSGGVGVDIFFVLSGFLITTILANEWAHRGGLSFRNFYMRRFLRLGPALVVTCLLVAIAKPAVGEPLPVTDILLALTYTSNWAQAFFGYHLTWLNHCWSLAIEEQFYLIWPWVIVALERSCRAPGAKAGLLLAGAAGIAAYRAWHVGTWTDERINFGLDTRMDTLMWGAALAYGIQWAGRARVSAGLDVGAPLAATSRASQATPLQGAREAQERPAGTRALHLLAPCALLTLFIIPQVVTWYSPWMGWIGYVIVAALSAVVIADLVASPRSWLAPVLSTRPMVFVGRISYGIYLLHLPVYFLVEKIIPQSPLLVRLGWKVSVSLALAAASYYLIEKRFLQMKERFSAERP